jgi:hypothetical protein
VKPNTTSVEVHPQLSNNGHPVDGVLVGAGSLWPYTRVTFFFLALKKSNLALIIFPLNLMNLRRV